MYELDILNQKRLIVEMAHEMKIPVHISPAFAMLEIFNVLLRDVMSTDKGIEDDSSDRLILSNGHVALGLYAVYETIGFISRDEFYTYKKKDSRLGVHQDRLHTPGAYISTGSLGHGLPNAVGVAYVWKIQGKSNRMFVTVGDGELNEGSIWESIIFASRMKLDNLCVIVVDNKSTEYMPDIVGKFVAFGCEAIEINGHDEESLRNILKKKPKDKPYVVVADTIKGHGVKFIEEKHAEWHEKVVSDDDYERIMEGLY